MFFSPSAFNVSCAGIPPSTGVRVSWPDLSGRLLATRKLTFVSSGSAWGSSLSLAVRDPRPVY